MKRSCPKCNHHQQFGDTKKDLNKWVSCEKCSHRCSGLLFKRIIGEKYPCPKCKKTKHDSEFHKCRTNPHGLAYTCRACNLENSRKFHKEHPDYIKNHYKNNKDRYKEWWDSGRLKIHARAKVQHAIKLGELIKPQKCQECGKKREIQAHHESYKKEDWLKVDWYCKDCHNSWHHLRDILLGLAVTKLYFAKSS